MKIKKSTKSTTISITIPEQLECQLKKRATKLGVSRSRFIGNILLDWQSNLPCIGKSLDNPNN